MTRWKQLLLALGVGLAIGLGSAWLADAQMRTLRADVASLNNSGITGLATLRETESGQLEVAIHVNDGSGNPLPAHIHEGICADLNPEPKIPLADVSHGASTTELTASLEQLTATPHAIFTHKSAEELPVFVGCADITDVLGVGQAPSGARAGSAGSGSLVGIAAGLVVFSLVLAAAGRRLRRGT